MGLRWEVGNGYTINAIKDAWIDTFAIKDMQIPLQEDLVHQNFKVQELMTPTKQWDMVKIRNTFGDDIAEAIKRIPIPISNIEDKLLWEGRSFSKYSIREAYKKIVPSSQSTQLGWNWIFRMNLTASDTNVDLES